MNFSIVKKLNKPAPKAAGLGLRSISGSPEAVMAVLYDLGGYDAVKESIAAFRLSNAGGVSYKTRGKSLEINVVSVELPATEAAQGSAGKGNAASPGVAAGGSLQDAPAYGKAHKTPRTDAVRMLFALLGECSFNTEDVLDVVEFVRECLSESFKPQLCVQNIELVPEFFCMDLSADIVDGQKAETIYSVLDPLCVKCGMGIIKERPEELSEND